MTSSFKRLVTKIDLSSKKIITQKLKLQKENMTSFPNDPSNSRAFHTKFLGIVLKNIFPVSSSNPHYDS